VQRSVSRRRFLGGVLGVAAGAALEACTLPVPGRAPIAGTSPANAEPSTNPRGVVFRNAAVLTMDPAHPVGDAVAIMGDTIIAVGREAEVKAVASPEVTIVDLGGRVLLPGFNDAHCHRIGDRAVTGYATAEAGIADALASGWTSISEMFVDQDRLDELRGLDDAGRLRLRVNAYLPANYLDDKFGIWFGAYQPHQTFSPNLRIGGVKLFADRARPDLMLVSQPHIDAPDFYGDAYWTSDEFTGLVRTLHDDGWQVATHTCGDAAHDLVLDAYEAALAGADNDAHRHRIEHVLMVRDDQVERMRDRSIVASIQLPFMSSDWSAAEEATLGVERLPWLGRWKDLLAAGVPVVGSTDFPWAIRDELNGRSGPAMKAVSDAVTRIGVEGVEPPRWLTDQALTVEQALDLITRAGAYATSEDDRKGTVTAGKLADLVVLSDDPRRVAAADLPSIRAMMTMVGGRAEYCAPDAGSMCVSSS
jgi:predicted amidohydrolase YtcJ